MGCKGREKTTGKCRKIAEGWITGEKCRTRKENDEVTGKRKTCLKRGGLLNKV